MSQTDLSATTGVSTRHLSYIETGKAVPTRQILLHLAAALDIPLRERNLLLLASGYAPQFPEGVLDDASWAAARSAFERVAAAHEPYPAMVIDRYWNVMYTNAGATTLLAAFPIRPPQPPNALRTALHPAGLAPHIDNLAEWSGYLLTRIRRQIAATADPELESLRQEVLGYPGVTAGFDDGGSASGAVTILRLNTAKGQLRLLNTITVLGAPLDTTLADLVLESFHPADDETSELLQLADLRSSAQ